MKKQILLFTILISFFGASAQITLSPIGSPIKLENAKTILPKKLNTNPFNRRSVNSSRSTSPSFWMNYSAWDVEAWDNVDPTGSNFYSELNLNRKYDTLDAVGINWGAMLFSQWIDMDQTGSTFPHNIYPPSAFSGTMDSLVISCKHVKTTASSIIDTVRVEILDYDAFTGIDPDTGCRTPLLWATNVYLDSSFEGGLERSQLLLLPNLVIPTGKRFIIQVEYFGPKADTFAIYSDFRDQNCDAACSYTGSHIPSGYVFGGTATQNSIAWAQFPTFDAPSFFLGLDCDSDGDWPETYDVCENWVVSNFEFFPHMTATVAPSASIISTLAEGCPGETTVLNLTPFGFSSTPTYNWTPATGLSSTTAEDPTLTIPASGTVTYTCTITSGADVATATIMIRSNGITVNAGTDQTISCGATANLAATVSGTTAGTMYSWSNGKTTPANTLVVAGIYTVTVTNNKGCTATDIVEVRYPGVSQFVGFSIPAPICVGRNVTFPNTSAKKTGWNFTWTSPSIPTSFLENGILMYTAAGPTTLKLEADSAGCKFSSTANITVKAASDPLCVNLPWGVGINEIDFANNVSVYPNPNNGLFELNIDGISADLSINIIDMTGKVIYTENTSKVNSYTKSINLNNVTSGVYFVKVQSGGNTAIKKLVIN